MWHCFSCKRQNGSQPFSVNISIIQDYSCVEAAESDKFTLDLKITMFQAIIASDINLCKKCKNIFHGIIPPNSVQRPQRNRSLSNVYIK